MARVHIFPVAAYFMENSTNSISWWAVVRDDSEHLIITADGKPQQVLLRSTPENFHSIIGETTQRLQELWETEGSILRANEHLGFKRF